LRDVVLNIYHGRDEWKGNVLFVGPSNAKEALGKGTPPTNY